MQDDDAGDGSPRPLGPPDAQLTGRHTPWHADARLSAMDSERDGRASVRRTERLAVILDALAETGTVHVGDLATRFRVSHATLRRDLALLEEQHLLTRTHGGALAQDVAYELPVRYRDGQHREAQRRIAQIAASRIPTGPYAVGLSGGTTTSEVAKVLAERADLTIVTNALNIAMELTLRPRVRVIVTGGAARSQSYELVGPWAEHTLAGINIGTAIVGVDGISAAAGITTHDEIEARTNGAMLSKAQRVIVVADGSKIGRVMLAHIAPITAVHEVVTDASADEREVELIRRAGVLVTVA